MIQSFRVIEEKEKLTYVEDDFKTQNILIFLKKRNTVLYYLFIRLQFRSLRHNATIFCNAQYYSNSRFASVTSFHLHSHIHSYSTYTQHTHTQHSLKQTFTTFASTHTYTYTFHNNQMWHICRCCHPCIFGRCHDNKATLTLFGINILYT